VSPVGDDDGTSLVVIQPGNRVSGVLDRQDATDVDGNEPKNAVDHQCADRKRLEVERDDALPSLSLDWLVDRITEEIELDRLLLKLGPDIVRTACTVSTAIPSKKTMISSRIGRIEITSETQ